MKISEELKQELKKPLGILIQDRDVTRQTISRYIRPDSYLVSVGDATSEKLDAIGFYQHLQIVDGVEKRKKRKLPVSAAKKLYCDNPAGQITEQAIKTIKEAMSMQPPVQIIVNGEEDLLVIPVCAFAPQNTLVFYGQPNEGLVIVHLTQEIRNKTKSILNL